MTTCIFTDNLNCRGQFRRLRSVRDALDQIHASFGTVKELTVLDGSDRILAFIPTRTTSGELKVWDYRTSKFTDPKILLRSERSSPPLSLATKCRELSHARFLTPRPPPPRHCRWPPDLPSIPGKFHERSR
jgi:hypothetical protein